MITKHMDLTVGLVLVAGSAFAQSSTVNGAAGGAVTGAIVGGPVGAAVGGVAGAVAGTVIDPPPERVVTCVREAPVPCRHGDGEGEGRRRPAVAPDGRLTVGS